MKLNKTKVIINLLSDIYALSYKINIIKRGWNIRYDISYYAFI